MSLFKKKLNENAEKKVNENIYIVLGNIVDADCECIVNAANSSLLGGGGVDGAIHKAAGKDLLKECRTLGGCNVGEAKITGGYNLKAKYVIHTVGPKYGTESCDILLRNAYINSLNLAAENGIKSIAFPAISTGIYKYPNKEAASIAISAVTDWLEETGYPMLIEFYCFDKNSYEIYSRLF